MELNEDQKVAFEKLKEFANGNKSHMCLLSGFAGVGKTFMMSHFVQWMMDNSMFFNIAIACPTNKGLRVIKESTDEAIRNNITYCTLHSLLGMKHEITKDGKEIFIRDKKVMSKFPNFDMVIVDEASMISDQLFLEMENQNFRNIKVLFVGDPHQINPVNHTMAIPMLEARRIEYNIGHVKLDKIVRQAEGNPIIKFSQKIINDKFEYSPGTKEIQGDSGVVIISSGQTKVLAELIKYYFGSAAFDNDQNYCKIIAWRNSTVDYYNRFVRAFKYGNRAAKIVLDEKLIVGKPIWSDDGTETRFVTNEDLVVKQIEIKEKVTVGGYKWKYYDCLVQGFENVDNIHILHESEEVAFAKTLKNMADNAASEADISKRIKKWKDFYNFKENFAEVKYAYSNTIHNCISKGMKVFVKDRGLINIEDVCVGDYIKNSFGFDKVLNKFDSGKKEELLVKTKNGYHLKCSKEHLLKIAVPDDSFQYKNFENIKIGDYLCIDRHNVSTDVKYDDISPLMGWYLGLLVGDGNYAGNYKKAIHRVELSVNGEDLEVLPMLKPLEDEFDIKINRYDGGYSYLTKRMRNMYRIIVDNKKFRDYLQDIGLKRGLIKEHKRTPDIIWKSSQKVQANYIKGLMDSDGSIDKRGQNIRFVNKSLHVVQELSLLLLLQGVISYIITNNKGYYVLNITGPSIEVYKKNIGFGLIRKQNLLKFAKLKKGKTNNDNIPFKEKIKKQLIEDFNTLCTQKNPTLCTVFRQCINFSYNHLQLCLDKYYEYNSIYKKEKDIPNFMTELRDFNYYYDPIVSIEKTGDIVDMYDLEVENNHEFTCNGIVVHNSQGSTYDNTFVMYSDIMLNKNEEERKRILYTAMTRPRKMLYVV